MMNYFKIYHSSTTDVGWFLVVWTLYTFIMWFTGMTKVAGYELMLCAISAWYMMAHVIFAQFFGKDQLYLQSSQSGSFRRSRCLCKWHDVLTLGKLLCN
ncbi:acetate uptake transporter family protein [Desulfobacula toluolica]|uniref:hypothetical protein n=1 Tax=Desulfobacula toluolica TaxID=28223 RepID=UPI0006856D65|nr:hypothetical protein [Desulfobacula toluolica]